MPSQERAAELIRGLVLTKGKLREHKIDASLWTTSRKLRFLARRIERDVKSEHFQMNNWVTECRNECGTAACALGWAAAIFQGLGTKVDGRFYHSVVIRVVDDVGNEDYAAGQKFFGITDGEAWDLFFPGNYPGDSDRVPKAAVVRKLRQIAKRYADQGE